MASTPQAGEQKLSRYRSQRRAPNSPPTTSDSSPPAETTNTVERSRSRYHRQAPQHQVQSPPPAVRNPEHRQVSGRHVSDSAERDQSPAIAGAERTLSPRAEAQRQRRLDENSTSRRVSNTKDNRRTTDRAGDDHNQRNDSPLSPERKKRITPPPPTEQAPRQIVAHRVDESDDEDNGPGCFGLFRKKKDIEPVRTEKTPITKKSSEPAFIKQGGGGIVPGTDAPKSAVNAGDRRVEVECNRSSMYFPVDATTTADNILKSAANCFSEPIDTKTYVLMESFGKVGVQRPLRKYERIREVINSWDDDLQNTLIAVPGNTFSSDPALLHLSNVPRLKPEETSFLLHYSQKVGKWDKRHIIIREDGQIVAKKSPSDKDKDATNICHLSDFDIYTPTPRSMSKKIKPPKKICYAIKSQQKTSMFESTTNFVHFFCASDRALALRFYTAVQAWRSWYLVNMMGEGQKKQPTPAETNLSPQRQTSVRSPAKNAHHHQPSSSMDSHYHLGSFKPLVDMDQFDERPAASAGVQQTQVPTRGLSTRDRNHPPLSLPKHLQNTENDTSRRSVDAERTSGTFASTGLLGRSYSQRQRDQAAREAQASKPFTEGPSLLNNADTFRPQTSDGPRRNTSTRQVSGSRGTDSSNIRRQTSTRNTNSVDLGRSTSRREQPKPLVDLTPTYREPPQFQRKGKGYKPDAVGPGGLVDNATSPEEAIQVPAATDWRGRRELHSSHGGPRPSSGNGAGSAAQRQQSRTRSTSRGRGPQVPRFQNSDAYAALTGGKSAEQNLAPERQGLRRQVSAEDKGFVDGGLLEQAGGGWGGQTTGKGRGASTTGKAGPLIDMSETSRYAPGSLLARQEGR